MHSVAGELQWVDPTAAAAVSDVWQMEMVDIEPPRMCRHVRTSSTKEVNIII